MKYIINNDLLSLEINSEQTIVTERGKTKGIGNTCPASIQRLSRAEGFDFHLIRTVTSR